MALRDEHTQVRQWMARRALLWREERRLLMRDPDPLVRASVWENEGSLARLPSPFSKRYERAILFLFRHRTPLERLGLMRNPNVPAVLVERVFDPADITLGIDLDEREQLVRASLANEQFFHRQKELAAGSDYDPPNYRFFQRLWERASAWPQDRTIVPYLTYRHVPVDDATRAKWYEQSVDLRGVILENCGADDDQTLALAVTGADPVLRQTAYAILGPSDLRQGEFTATIRATREQSSLGFGNRQMKPYQQASLHLEGSLLEVDRNVYHGDIRRDTHASVEVDIEFTEDGKPIIKQELPRGYIGRVRWHQRQNRASSGSDKETRAHVHANVELTLPLTMRPCVPATDRAICMEVTVDSFVKNESGDSASEDDVAPENVAADEGTGREAHERRKTEPVTALIKRADFAVDMPKTSASEVVDELATLKDDLAKWWPLFIFWCGGPLLATAWISRADSWLVGVAKMGIAFLASAVVCVVIELWREKRQARDGR
jgi:hypothetical protein